MSKNKPMDERLKITEYDQAARVIHLYLKRFCDESLPYPAMVADAARVADAEIAKLEKKLKIAVEALATLDNKIEHSTFYIDRKLTGSSEIISEALKQIEEVGK